MSNESRSVIGIEIPSRIDFALIARGLAALAVVWWHVVGYKIQDPIGAAFTPPGRLSVWVFFALSGFLIGSGFVTGRYGFERASIVAFYRNRWLRIYPLFLLILIFSYFLHWCLGNAPVFSVDFVRREVFMLQWKHEYVLNGVFWTLGVELQFYLLAPIFFRLQMRFRAIPVVAAVTYSILLLYMRFQNLIWPEVSIDARDLLGNLIHFQAGFLIYILRPAIESLEEKLGRWLLRAIGIILPLIILIADRLYFKHFSDFLGYQGILLTDLLSGLVLVAHILIERQNRPIGQLAVILQVLGSLSYGIYAWHGALLIIPFFRESFSILLLATLLLAFVGYVWCEKPASRLKVRGRAKRLMDASFDQPLLTIER